MDEWEKVFDSAELFVSLKLDDELDVKSVRGGAFLDLSSPLSTDLSTPSRPLLKGRDVFMTKHRGTLVQSSTKSFRLTGWHIFTIVANSNTHSKYDLNSQHGNP